MNLRKLQKCQDMKTVVRKLVLCFILVILIAFFVRHYDGKEYMADNKQGYINSLCKMENIPALSVALWNNDTEEYLNYSDNDKVNENTLYELASTTKAFTGLGIIQLHDSGLLKFDDSVDKYIPEFCPTYNGKQVKVTIEQLLNHSSGIPPYALDLIPEEEFNEGELANSLSRLFDVELIYKPGSKYEYATVNYDLLALIIERIAGMGYEDYIKVNVLNEAGMSDSFFRTDDIHNNVVQGYKPAFFSTCPYNAPVYYGNTAAGYLISNTSDLMKWIKRVNLLFDFESFPISTKNDYFAGWHICTEYAYHGGNNPNFSSYVYVSRDEPRGVFVLSAKAGDSAEKIANALYRMQHGETVKMGLYTDFGNTLDLLFVIIPMLMIYVILWIPNDTKVKALIRLIIGGVIASVLLAFPFVSPVSCRYCFVWFPGSLIFFIGTVSLLAFYLIVTSIMSTFRRLSL